MSLVPQSHFFIRHYSAQTHQTVKTLLMHYRRKMNFLHAVFLKIATTY